MDWIYFKGKWNFCIICVLANKKTLRYTLLRKEMVNITDAVLVPTLKHLISNGIIERKSYDEILPRIEYVLISRAEPVVPILQDIC